MSKNLNKSTKLAQGFLHEYNRADAVCLSDIYKSYSDAKRRAYDFCKADCEWRDGFSFRIISANCMTFTCAFTYFENDIDYPNILRTWIRVHTAYNTYDICLD